MEVEEKVQSSKVSQNYDNALESNPTFFDVTDNHIKLPGTNFL